MTRVKKSAFSADVDMPGETLGLEASLSLLQCHNAEHTLFQYIITVARQWNTSPQLFFRLAKGLDKKVKPGTSMQALCTPFGLEYDGAERKKILHVCSLEECPSGEFDAMQVFSREDNPWLSLTVAELLPEDITVQHAQEMSHSGRHGSSSPLFGETSMVRAKTPRYRIVLLFAAMVIAMLAGFYTGWLPEKLLLFSRYSSERTVKIAPALDNSLRKNATLVPDTAVETPHSGVWGTFP